MAPTKSNDRILPLTEQTWPYFEQQLAIQQRRKELTAASGASYYDNDLVVAKLDGAPFRRDAVSTAFGQLIRHLELPHLRFHDLRHPYVKPTTKKFITFFEVFRAAS